MPDAHSKRPRGRTIAKRQFPLYAAGRVELDAGIEGADFHPLRVAHPGKALGHDARWVRAQSVAARVQAAELEPPARVRELALQTAQTPPRPVAGREHGPHLSAFDRLTSGIDHHAGDSSGHVERENLVALFASGAQVQLALFARRVVVDRHQAHRTPPQRAHLERPVIAGKDLARPLVSALGARCAHHRRRNRVAVSVDDAAGDDAACLQADHDPGALVDAVQRDWIGGSRRTLVMTGREPVRTAGQRFDAERAVGGGHDRIVAFVCSFAPRARARVQHARVRYRRPVGVDDFARHRCAAAQLDGLGVSRRPLRHEEPRVRSTESGGPGRDRVVIDRNAADTRPSLVVSHRASRHPRAQLDRSASNGRAILRRDDDDVDGRSRLQCEHDRLGAPRETHVHGTGKSLALGGDDLVRPAEQPVEEERAVLFGGDRAARVRADRDRRTANRGHLRVDDLSFEPKRPARIGVDGWVDSTRGRGDAPDRSAPTSPTSLLSGRWCVRRRPRWRRSAAQIEHRSGAHERREYCNSYRAPHRSAPP